MTAAPLDPMLDAERLAMIVDIHRHHRSHQTECSFSTGPMADTDGHCYPFRLARLALQLLADLDDNARAENRLRRIRATIRRNALQDDSGARGPLVRDLLADLGPLVPDPGPCQSEKHSWDLFRPEQVDSYWMRCCLTAGHEAKHENSETGATWSSADTGDQ